MFQRNLYKLYTLLIKLRQSFQKLPKKTEKKATIQLHGKTRKGLNKRKQASRIAKKVKR